MHLRTGITLLAAALLAACGGGGGGSASAPMVSGAVVKGPVLGATVCAYTIAGGVKGAPLVLSAVGPDAGAIVAGCFVTGADGGYRFALPADTRGDVLLEATGGRFCSDESPLANGACGGSATLVDLAGSVMSSVASVAPDSVATVYTTPLSSAAVAAAGASLSAASFADQFVALAAQLGAGSGITPTTVPTAASQAYLAQVAAHLAGGGTLAGAVQTLASGSTNFSSSGGTGAGATTPGTVHASFVGTRSLEFRAGGGEGCGSRCSYTEGQAVAVTVRADGTLVLPHKELTGPFLRNYGSGPHLPEIIWLDAEAGIEYALSDNSSGSFNEINVGDASRPGPLGSPAFLGQLRAPAATGDAALAALTALAGSYTIGYQYKGGDVPWTGVTIAGDGSISFTGGTGPDVPASAITEVIDRLNCCARLDVQVSVDVDGDNAGPGDDRISLFLDHAGALRSIEYEAGSPLSTADDVGVRLGSVAALVHDGSAVPAGNAIHGTLGSTVLDFAPLGFVQATSTGFTLEATAGGGSVAPAQWLLQVSAAAPLQQGSSYDCRRKNGPSVLINVRTADNGTLLSTTDGGRCTVTVTRLVSDGSGVAELEGRFVAEFVPGKQSAVPVTVTNGVFRYVR